MKKITLLLFVLLPFFCFSQDTLVKWTFPNNPDDSVADGGITANLAMTISAKGGVSAMNFASQGATTYCVGTNAWTGGALTKYWQVKVVTLGYQALHFSSKQKSSAYGPRDFKVQYKIDYSGTWTDVPGAVIMDTANWTKGALTNCALPSACENQDTVYIRWLMTSNISSNGGAVASNGTERIDDIIIAGTSMIDSPPTVINAFATGYNSVKVKFDKGVNTTATNVANYTGLGTISTAVRSVTNDTVTLTLTTPLSAGVVDTVTISNVQDIAGTSMTLPQKFPVLWGNPNSQNIVITEIMYNPPEAGTDTLEFIELFNNGATTVSLKDFYFSMGVNYTFHNDSVQPQAYYLVTVDSIAFVHFYHQIAHQWTSGSLSNTGEAIVLKDNYGSLVDSVYYHTTSPWPTAANGNGSSMMLCSPSSNNNVGSSWSAAGAANSLAFGVVNNKEVYATPGAGCMTITVDTVPPFVTMAMATNLSTVKVFFNENLNYSSSQNIANYTGLVSIASAVRTPLTTVTLNLATPLVPGIPDTLTINNVRDSAGNQMITPQSFVVIYNNLIEDVAISEIMYNDPSSNADSLEFIELYNRGTTIANISSYNFSHGPTITFPVNTFINPGGYLVIAYDTTAVNNFFHITGTLQWASGNLANTSEKLEIRNSSGNVIDSLTYRSTSPWPTTPNGNGPSLTLCNPALDNSVGANWSASTEYAGILNGVNVYATPGAGCYVAVVHPTVTKAYAISLSSVKVIFSEAVNSTADTVANYTGLGSITTALRSVTNDTVTLALATPLTPGIAETLTVANVQNLGGTAMANPQSFPIIYNNTVDNIVITEIMYNDPSLNADSLEFIELYNNGSTAANIGGYSFSNGIVYEFPGSTIINPSSYLVIAKNAHAVNNFFGISGTLQWTSGVLNNAGDILKIVNSDVVTIDSVNYGISNPWPISPNGNGPSLTFCDPNLDNSVAANWTASTELAGVLNGVNVYATPGAGCNPVIVYPTVLNAYAVSLTSVKVIFSDAMNTTAESVANYTGLGSITTAVRSVTYDTVTLTLTTPLLNGVLYTLTIANVQNLANNAMAAPQNFNILFNSSVDNIVITEIMYNDPSVTADSLEFIELYNNGATAANIGGYSFSQGVVCEFPASTIINPSSYLVIAKDAQAVNNFFSITGTLQWTSGALSNTGETIKIVNSENTTIDSVTYGVSSPWPTSPNGSGPSLTFCDPSLDNAIAINWLASTELAGTLNSMNVYATPGSGCVITGLMNVDVSSEILLYPNPAQGIANIYHGNQPIEIKLFDVVGNLISFATSKDNSETKLNIGNLQTGMYVVQIRKINTNETIVKKLIIY